MARQTMTKNKTKTPTSTSLPAMPSADADDQLTTRRMLYLVRDELKSDIGVLDRKISALELRMDLGFHELKGEFHKFQGSLSRMELMLEGQKANNRVVLEGLQGLWQHQDRLENTVSKSS